MCIYKFIDFGAEQPNGIDTVSVSLSVSLFLSVSHSPGTDILRALLEKQGSISRLGCLLSPLQDEPGTSLPLSSIIPPPALCLFLLQAACHLTHVSIWVKAVQALTARTTRIQGIPTAATVRGTDALLPPTSEALLVGNSATLCSLTRRSRALPGLDIPADTFYYQ